MPRIRINDKKNLDELSVTLQKIIAYMDTQGVDSLDGINLYFSPMKPSGKELMIKPAKLDEFEIMPDKPQKDGGGNGYKKSYSKRR